MNSSDLTGDELREILTEGDFEYIFRTAMGLYNENLRLREEARICENRKEQAEIELVKYKKAIKAAKEEASLQIVYYGEKFRAALNKLGDK